MSTFNPKADLVTISCFPHGALNTDEVSGKFQRNDAANREFWQHTTRYGWLQQGHPGANVNACPLGLYGDDCRYNKAGEKLVVINFNLLLQEARSLFLPFRMSVFFFGGLFNDPVRFGLVPVPSVPFEGFSNGARLLVDTSLPTPDMELQCPLPN